MKRNRLETRLAYSLWLPLHQFLNGRHGTKERTPIFALRMRTYELLHTIWFQPLCVKKFTEGWPMNWQVGDLHLHLKGTRLLRCVSCWCYRHYFYSLCRCSGRSWRHLCSLPSSSFALAVDIYAFFRLRLPFLYLIIVSDSLRFRCFKNSLHPRWTPYGL